MQDFRSENGLYSLIQARFDAASRREQQGGEEEEEGEEERDENEDDDTEDDLPPPKRRKTRDDDDCIVVKDSADDAEPTLPEPLEENKPRSTICVGDTSSAMYATPRAKTMSVLQLQLDTSPLSSPPADEFIIPPSVFRSRTINRLAPSLPLSSSPLSSPPAVLFDPFRSDSSSETASESGTAMSETDETEPSSTFLSSQNSLGGRSTLPNMKGKDLFDARIWADPIRTSVFYTFATSLRQKVKRAEPTSSHRFIRHLRDRGKLVRCYTQNIDQIEEKVGLSTCLEDGPGSRARFSRRPTANTSQLDKMVREGNSEPPASQPETSADSSQDSQGITSDGTSTSTAEGVDSKSNLKTAKKAPPRSGVECVFLHGSLELLRCFLCGRVCSWDDDLEYETLSGEQPDCPHCLGAATAREERGKRALGVGRLRPDIVLYGEEHPNSHLISPIVTHDLGLYPDMLLILGTSLRVHGLKVMVREFAKAVHSKGGKVVFVNFTRPPDSIWGDIIDYWVQWDCDAWVSDLQTRIPKMWQEPDAPKPRRKKTLEQAAPKPPPANPVAVRDTKVTGAYWTMKAVTELHRITGMPDSPPQRRASMPSVPKAAESSTKKAAKSAGARQKRPRQSAPGALERRENLPLSTLNPNHGRARNDVDAVPSTPQMASFFSVPHSGGSSILSSVKENPRVRRRKVIDGVEVLPLSVGKRCTVPSDQKENQAPYKLAPLLTGPGNEASPFGKPQPLEPRSPPAGPLSSLSPNIHRERAFQKSDAFVYDDALVRLLDKCPSWADLNTAGSRHDDLLAGPLVTRTEPRKQLQGLMMWGSTWRCNR